MRPSSDNFVNLRRAFTLLELLMVVAIIAVLASLSVVVMINIADQANEAATVTTIQKIDGLLEARLESFERAFSRSGPFQDRYIEAAKALLKQDSIYGPIVRSRRTNEGDDIVVRLLAKKVAMRHLFPQRHEDLLLLDFGPDGVTPFTDIDATNNIMPLGSRALDGTLENRISFRVEATATDLALLPTADAWVNDETVSAELLYFFLVHSASLGASEDVLDQFRTSEIADTDNDGLPEFIDAWGNPLRFYRWPTRMIDILPPTPFQPDLFTVEATDVAPLGPRVITDDERAVANIMIKGLAPAPVLLPGNVDLNGDGDFTDANEVIMPRDMLLLDPDDSIGVLYRALEEYDGTVDLNGDGDTDDPGESDGAPLRNEFNESNYHTPDTYHTPLLVSAGADGELGLYEPSDTVNLGNLAAYDLSGSGGLDGVLERIGDNLTNRNRRAGGRR